MSQSRDGLHGSFLPLFDAVEATSRRVQGISVGQIDLHRDCGTLKDENSFEVKAERSAVHRMLQQARAAGLIFQLLKNGKGKRPEWHASVDGQHFPDDTVRRLGNQQLIWLSNRALPSRRDAAPPEFKDGSELTLIGFDIDDFIRFLDVNGVPHTLGEPNDEESHEEAAAVDLPDASVADASVVEGGTVETIVSEANAPETNLAEASPAEAIVPEASDLEANLPEVDPPETGTTWASSAVIVAAPPLEPRRFNGIWAEALLMAWKAASVRDDARSTYAALCAIARAPNPPEPILGYVSGEGVKWEDDEAEDGIGFFTLKNMRDRMRPRKPVEAQILKSKSKAATKRRTAAKKQPAVKKKP